MNMKAKKLNHDDHPMSDPVSNISGKALFKIDPMSQYLNEIRKYKLLTPEDQRSLAIRFKENGDREAAQLLVASNLRLVIKIALDFQRVWMQNLLDLIQEGNLGLMVAVTKFDPYRGVKFSYYASFWIKAYILKFIMDNWRLVKIGTTQAQRKLFFNLNKEKRKLIDQGFDPSPKLLSQKLGISDKQIIEMDQRLNGWDVSLDAPLKEDAGTEMSNFIPAEKKSQEEEIAQKQVTLLLNNKIDDFRGTISDRERDIFDRRIFSEDPLTLQQLGTRHGISRERIRQVEKEIIDKIKIYLEQEIPDFNYLSQYGASAAG
jgi:RNA polymerase sigma-32 factor